MVDANGGKCDGQSSGTPIKKFGSHIQVRFLSQSQRLLDVKYVQQQTLEKFGFS